MSVLASDNFTRTNNTDLGASWDPCSGESCTSGFQISSNTAIPNCAGASDSSETNNAVSWPNDQYSKVTFGATAGVGGVGAGSGPTVRAATGATKTYYRCIGSAAGYELGKKVAGTFTSLRSGAGTTFAAADTLELRAVGTTLTMLKNGVQFDTITDSSIASGRAGIAYSSEETTETLSAWEGGDVSTGKAPPPPRNQTMQLIAGGF